MRRKAVLCSVIIAVIILISSCGPGAAAPASQTPEKTAGVSPTATTAPKTSKVITIWSFSQEVPNIAEAYAASHPEFGYRIDYLTNLDDYQGCLDKTLAAGPSVIDGFDAPDIYCTESSNVMRYAKGEMSGYAIPYKDLGIDVGGGIAAAKMAQYVVDIGTRPSDNEVIGLGYQGMGGAFIYRRSIAKTVWGTDDPAVIAGKIGPGWDQFFKAASELKKKGYAIVSGSGDIWQPVAGSSEKGWIEQGKLYIDPKREAFLDYSKELVKKGYTNGTKTWTDEWYNDMADAAKKKVFGFFGPTWFINYVMANHSGAELDTYGKLIKKAGTWGDWAVCEPTENFFWSGIWLFASKELEKDPEKKAAVGELLNWMTLDCTKDGLQYAWANGELDLVHGVKDAVNSETVMEMCSGASDFLGGQDIFRAFLPANRNINSGNITDYDLMINNLWLGQADRYAGGKCTREEAIAAFRKAVKDECGIDAM